MLKQIHPDDDMYCGSLGHYEACGIEFADFIFKAAKITEIVYPKILELPCGYGRVTRHLSKKFTPQQIFVADAMKPAVKFCVEQFGVSGIEIVEPLNEFINIPDEMFDVAAMGSLVTHLSESSTEVVLEHFLKKITSKGIAVITTHGVRAHDFLTQDINWFELTRADREYLKVSYREERFGYVPYAPNHSFEKKTVDYVGKSYGISLIPHSWMLKTIKRFGFSVLEYMPGGWDNHQDVFIVGK